MEWLLIAFPFPDSPLEKRRFDRWSSVNDGRPVLPL
jgi:hypothetical protein